MTLLPILGLKPQRLSDKNCKSLETKQFFLTFLVNFWPETLFTNQICFQVQHLQDKSLNLWGKRTWKSVTFEKMYCMVISNLVISLVQKKISVKYILTAFAIHHCIVNVGWNLTFFLQIRKILMFAYHTNFWIFRDKM